MDKCDLSTLSPATIERFWAKVDQAGGPDACWPWTSYRSAKGYGVLRHGHRNWRAHRLAFLFTHGAIPDAGAVCHRCDNPACCNPAHLWLGTIADNNADMVAKGRNVYVPLFGEANGQSRLREDDVRAIIAEAESRVPHRDIAKRFGVARSTVTGIALRKRWKHVPREYAS